MEVTMKRLFVFLCIIALFATTASAGILNSFDLPKAIEVGDTTSLATYDTIVNVAGKGMLYRVVFNNDATHDATIKITIDGTAEEITRADDEEISTFVIRAFTPSVTGADNDIFSWSDSTHTALDLNLPFQNQLKIEHKSAASGRTQTRVLYGVVK
jgi:hypothetical protein